MDTLLKLINRSKQAETQIEFTLEMERQGMCTAGECVDAIEKITKDTKADMEEIRMEEAIKENIYQGRYI